MRVELLMQLNNIYCLADKNSLSLIEGVKILVSMEMRAAQNPFRIILLMICRQNLEYWWIKKFYKNSIEALGSYIINPIKY